MLFPITVVMLVPIVALKFVADSSDTDDSPVMIVGRIGSDEKIVSNINIECGTIRM